MCGKLKVVIWLPMLAIIVASTGLAASGLPTDDVIPLIRNDPPANPQTEPLETGTIISVQTGTPLVVPGTFCVGDWMGQRIYRIVGTFCGGEVYYTLQDPSLTIPYSWNPAACSPSYTFNATAVNMEVSKRPTSGGLNPFTFNLQPIIFDADLSTPGCPIPGGVRCAGPVYAVTLTGGSTSAVTFKVNLPFIIECCVSGPYFAAVYLAGTWPCDIAQVTTDDQTLSVTPPAPPPQVCHQYVYDPAIGGRYDWIRDNFAYHLRLYSEGYTPNDVATQCTPGLCASQIWYEGDPAVGYRVSGTSTRRKHAVCFMSDGLDTLKSVEFYLAGSLSTVPLPDILVEVWAGDGAGSSCAVSPLPGTLLESITIPGADVVVEPLANVVPLSNHVWGVLNGGPWKAIFVSIEVPPSQEPLATAFLGCSPQAAGCPADPHSLAYYSASAPLPGWHYLGEVPTAYTQREFKMSANICKERVPHIPGDCPSPGSDNWNTWMHDYQRTGASAMSVDNSCGVRAQWSKFLPHYSNFTEPVVAGGKVYVASDQELNALDLTTGALVGTVSGFPYVYRENRCNVSVEGNRVFLTGGTYNSISCWDTSLTTALWSDDALAPGLTTVSNGALTGDNRFGVVAVYAIGSDSVVVVGTELEYGVTNGWLYALDVQTGYLYNGWATNPIELDRSVYHSPAFDGTSLYVGTSSGFGAGGGSLYSIDAVTGTIRWRFKDALCPNESWSGGVSVEGDYLYGATYDYIAGAGHRYKINKSDTSPVVVWRYSEGPTLYAAPTIGRNFLYIPQDNPSSGVLMVDKLYGRAVHNFATNGVGSVPQPVTLTCDNFLFAGDRLGYWYLLNATDLSAEWRRRFTGIVNGTALAHHQITGDDYAVVSARSSYSGPAGAGVVTAWRFGQPDRPFLHQYVYSTEIQIPLNSGSGLFHTEPGVYGNDGCTDLHITATNLYDYPVSAAAKSYSTLHAEYATTLSKFKTGTDYASYFDGTPKQLRRAGLAFVDGELNSYDLAIEKASEAFQTKRRAPSNAASAVGILRTSNVTYSRNPIPDGGITNVSWNYDGTGLGRGSDDETIESVNDDPDFYPEDLTYANMGYPSLQVHYIGGCPEQNTILTWNTLGAPNSEKVWNHGALGDGYPGSLVWGADAGYDGNLYDGGFLLLGDSSAVLGGAQFRIDYHDFHQLYRPNVRPSDSTCGFDAASNIHLGWRRQSGCPGQPVEIMGAWVRSAFADTNEWYPPTSPLSSMGVNVIQTEVGAYDPMYGDFKLISWKLENRDAVLKELKAGSFIDWDVVGSYITNVGLLSDNFNGYAQWDAVTPRYAFGMFDPNLPTAYCGVDPTVNAPHKISSLLLYGFYCDFFCWPGGAYYPVDGAYGWFLAVRPPYRYYELGPPGPSGYQTDRGVFLVNKGFTLPAGGTYDVVQAMYAVPATSNDVATIDALGVEVAKRAARWAGFARGDVNDDGCVNLADVCWLSSGNLIYPDTYCGDVNNDGTLNATDRTYLLNYVSGSGPAPLGAWRFTF